MYRNKDSNYWRKKANHKVKLYWSNLKRSKHWVGSLKNKEITTSSKDKKHPPT